MNLFKKSPLLAVALIFQIQLFAQEFHYKVDLNHLDGNKLVVNLQIPPIKSEDLTFRMPRIIPGTYSVYDFGRFISDFEAFDENGKPLNIEKENVNSYKIKTNGRKVFVRYKASGTFDFDYQDKNIVFEPAGTTFEKDEVYVFNAGAVFGYIDGFIDNKYHLEVTKNEGFYPSTGLNFELGKTKDKFTVANYHILVDSPIMYNIPDTTFLKVGNTDVLISVYNKSKKVSSADLADAIAEVLEAQRKYLGGTLPVDKYAFIVYLFEGRNASGGSGALEHNNSSFYFLPVLPLNYLKSTMADVAAHEFFHILTPLTLHSEEIRNFDYYNPKMSKHLWLYEGVTEYFAGHVQKYYGLMDLQQYLNIIKQKYAASKGFKDDLPFTELSLGALDKHKSQYINVYQKGALIGLCLDLKIREVSKGKYSLVELLLDLSKKYGVNKAFKDEELFDEIARLGGDYLKEFFNRYVAGSDPLPLAEYLMKAGIFLGDKEEPKATLGFDFRALSLDLELEKYFLRSKDFINDFGREIGLKENDLIYSINGIDLTIANRVKDLDAALAKSLSTQKIEIVVGRKDKKGNVKKSKLTAPFRETMVLTKNVIMPIENPTEAQQAMLKNWLN